MLDVLTHDVPGLVATLRTGYFARACLRVAAIQGVDEIVERALAQAPDVVMLTAGAQARARERAIAHLLSVQPREATRIPVPIPARLVFADGTSLEAVGVDLSASGAGLHVREHEPAVLDHVVFQRSDGRQVCVKVEVRWREPLAEGGTRMGVRFVGASLEEVRGLYDLAFWRVEREPDGDVVYLQGGDRRVHLVRVAAAGRGRAPAPGPRRDPGHHLRRRPQVVRLHARASPRSRLAAAPRVRGGELPAGARARGARGLPGGVLLSTLRV